ncbi:MAG: 4-hydroxy-tetrahydrodipicolinate reductase [Bariatricus sp.]|nr:4-hydroxy-tetrahydrodipicolinate reductase [Bariatricus sp.]
MVRAIMHGCNGKMGQVITGLVKEDEQIEIVAGVDAYLGIRNEYPTFKSLAECNVEADVVIDFSNASAVDELLEVCVERKLPVVLCTTGLSDEQLEKVEKATEFTAVLRSANMSLGINLLMKLLKEAAKVLSPAGFDIELVEKHHNQKVDAPSGTAIALADSINEALDEKFAYNFDRSHERKKREKDEIGIVAVRGGTIVGQHDVIFAGADEVIEFQHTAYSKAVFGKGAIEAAKFLKGQPSGRYDMSDVIKF